ncbi:MAG: tripartite tricarboxylate transporter TctB family protein [Alphaproteobacteria bacterium]|nr:tripartite tricarboxylate transporter TctB family protein [Alphaproteobacteria bacterium]
MTDDNETDNPEKKSVGGELILPGAALLFTLYYFYTIWDVPRIAQVSALFVGTILIVLVILLGIRIAKQVKAGEADLGLGRIVEPKNFIPKRLALLGLTIAFIYFVDWLGFTLTVFAFLALAMLLLSEGKKKLLIVSLSAVVAIGGYFLFIVAFQTRFPAGPFEKLMAGLF